MSEKPTVADVVTRLWGDVSMDRDGMLSPEPLLMITDMGEGCALVNDHILAVLERVNGEEALAAKLAEIKNRRAGLFTG